MPRRALLPFPAIATAFVLAASLALSAQAQPAVAASPPAVLPTVELPKALDDVLRSYERAFRARDAAALAALFTEDGFALPEGMPPMRGRAVLQEAFARVGGPLSLRALAYREQGGLATIVGAYRFRDDGAGADDGKFVLTLLRDPSGAWRIFSDMDSGNARPRPPVRPQP